MPLHPVVFAEYLIQESGTYSSAMSCSFGENKSKGLKISDGLEGERQRQSGDGAVSLPANQHEAGKGSQKKPQSRRRDQKSSGCPDMLGKPGARSLSSSSKRSPFPGKLQGEKGSPTDHLRWNASSLGLQELSSGSFTGSLGRVKSKIPGERLSSGQRRPRSLEFTIFSRERELLNPETLLSQEKMRSDHTDSAATPSEVATLDVGATVAPEKGSRNPEHSMIPKEGAFRKTLSNVSLSKGKTTCEHPESIGPSKKNGIEGQEPPETSREVAGGELHQPSGPEVPPSSGKEGSRNSEDLASLGMVTCAGVPSQAFYLHCVYVTRSLSGPQDPQHFENLR